MPARSARPFTPLDGFAHHVGYLDRKAQEALVETLAPLIEEAPFYRATMPRTGTPLRVPTTNLGRWGWYSDTSGYRYIDRHPKTGRPWPALPPQLIEIWGATCNYAFPPDACLVNLYRDGAKLGLHIDHDEEDLAAPVVSISLGDSARYHLGGHKRNDPTAGIMLHSGDVVVLERAARLAYHGVDKVLEGSSTLIPSGGRINLTLRRAKRPE